MIPRIGITCGEDEAGRLCLPRGCAEAVALAGGQPVLLPPLAAGVPHPALLAGDASPPLARHLEELAEAAAEGLDGLFLSGGFDIDPRLFGEDPAPALGRLEPDRDAWETALIRVALRRDMPVLAVCRGMQILNVAAGGTMYQDLPSQRQGVLKHLQDAPPWYPTHSVTVEPESRLAAALRGDPPGDAGEHPARAAGLPAPGLALPVNSFHHQAVRDVAPGFRAVAFAPDGVVEAVESEGHRWVVGVQWHPEALASGAALGAGPEGEAPRAAPWEAARRLFRAFVAASAGRSPAASNAAF